MKLAENKTAHRIIAMGRFGGGAMELARLKISGERLYRLHKNLPQCKGRPGKHHKDPYHMALPQSFTVWL